MYTTVEPPYEARDTLRAWQQRNHPWLELSDVHKEVTDGVRVTVIPFYMGCREAHTNQTSDVYWVCGQYVVSNIGLVSSMWCQT